MSHQQTEARAAAAAAKAAEKQAKDTAREAMSLDGVIAQITKLTGPEQAKAPGKIAAKIQAGAAARKAAAAKPAKAVKPEHAAKVAEREADKAGKVLARKVSVLESIQKFLNGKLAKNDVPADKKAAVKDALDTAAKFVSTHKAAATAAKQKRAAHKPAQKK